MSRGARPRPRGITALAVFFGMGALISLAAGVSFVFPGGPLEPMWRLNPRAQDAFGRLGRLSVVVLVTVSLACGLAAVGLWKGRSHFAPPGD